MLKIVYKKQDPTNQIYYIPNQQINPTLYPTNIIMSLSINVDIIYINFDLIYIINNLHVVFPLKWWTNSPL